MLVLSHLPVIFYGAALLLASAIGGTLTPVIGKWAMARGIVAAPRQDRWHTSPTPLLGGVAIFIAATLVILVFSQLDQRLLGLLAGASILFVAGLVDDVRRLRPHTKLILQILAACVLVLSGVKLETASLAPIAIPLTIVWVVGLTNAFNLLDNMDGLSSGTAAITAGFLFAFSLSVGDAGSAILCLAVAGASLGFLLHNFNPARIFMGDCGSMFLGFTLSGIALMGTREMASDVFFVLLVPVAMMGLPIFDTTLVTILRTIEGRPLAQGGRDHVSHRLVAMGLSEKQAVLALYGLALVFGLLGLMARSLGVWASLAAGGALLALVVLLGAYLAQVRIYRPGQLPPEAESAVALSDRPVINGMILFKRELGLAALDFVLICVAYVAAFVLRFGLSHPTSQPAPFQPLPDVFSATLPFVVAVKLLSLLLFRSYRGIWRYVGMSDLLMLVKASAVATFLLVVGLPFIVRGGLVVPKSVLIIDWLVYLVVLVGSRVFFAAITDMAARLQNQRLPHVLIVGAGDLGELVLRSVLRSRPLCYQAVGFLDPDPAKRNRTIHGVRVLGTVHDLERVTSDADVDLVVVALAQADRGLGAGVDHRCAALGIPDYPAAAFVEMHFLGAARANTLPPVITAPAGEPTAIPD